MLILEPILPDFDMDHNVKYPLNQILAYIVMPPGHGKSYHHNALEGLLEADSVYNCKSDKELAALRKAAKTTGEWETYDAEWAKRLLPLFPKRPCVIMVPSEDVGDALGAIWLGSAQLSEPQWAENLAKRSRTPADYDWGTLRGNDSLLFTNNNDLSTWLLYTAEAWMLKQKCAPVE
jgi:hypothetical protein